MSGQLRERIAFKGLITNPNELSLAGDGAMREFTNMCLPRPDLAEKRRGVTRCATNTAAINKLFNYDAGQIFHSGSGGTGALKKYVPSTGVITAYSGQVNPISGRLRSCISGKNFYYGGTVPGKLSGLAGTPVAAGGLFAPGFDLLGTQLLDGTVLEQGKSVAFRCLFGSTDSKGYLILGEPSARLIVTNQLSTTNPTARAAAVNPTVRAIVPSGATTKHFIQIYRSAKVAAGTQPDDDLQLVYEAQLKSTDLTNKYVDVADIVPESLRGAFVYTSPNAAEGIAAANRPPPSCVELCDFASRAWYANTVQPGEFFFSILGIGGTGGIQPLDTLVFGYPLTQTFLFDMTARRSFGASIFRAANLVTVTTAVAHGYSNGNSVRLTNPTTLFGAGPFVITVTGATTFTYAEVAADVVATDGWSYVLDPAAGVYITETSGTAGYNIQTTAINFCAAFNKNANNTLLWAQWVSAPGDLDQGRILIRGRTAATGAFGIGVSTLAPATAGTRACFAPVLSPVPSGASLTRAANVVTATTILPHGLIVGESVTIAAGGAGSAGSTFGTGPFVITTVATALTFTYAEVGVAGTLAGQTATLYPTDNSLADVESQPNRVYYSKAQRAEATTRDGWLDVGSPDTAILAMKSQRGQIWVWKTDGIYRIRGFDPSNFVVEAMDSSVRCLATESVILFNNRCWGLTDRGVVAVSESGLEVMSGAIDNDLRLMISTVNAQFLTAGAPGVEADCFATAYESQRQYILHVPDILSNDTTEAFGGCRYAYVYTSPPPGSLGVHGTWALWDWGISIVDYGVAFPSFAKRCALVGLTDDKLYLGDGFNGVAGAGYVYQERKSSTMSANYEDDTGDSVTASLTRTGGTTVTATVASHGFRVGQRIRLLTGGALFTAAGPYTITAVDATTFTFLYAGANGTTAGQVCVLSAPVAAKLTWALQTEGAPGAEKRWDELEFHFAPMQLSQNAPFTETQVAIEVTLSNYGSTTFTLATQGSQVSRCWVQADYARGQRLGVRVTHSTAGELFVLAGMSVRAEVLAGGAPSR